MIKCLAIDDENLALDLLEDNISQVPFLHFVKRCKNAFEAMEVLQSEKIDLIFLDIQMPGITGLQFLQSLQSRPMVIVVSAYKEYALDGYNMDVMDYLVKPVSFERFLKACSKALEYYNLKNNIITKHEDSEGKEFFFVNSDYALIKVVSEEIAYIEGQKDYIQIHMMNGAKPLVTRMSFREIEDKLPAGKFIRTHKSFIVPINKMESVRAGIIVIEKAKIPLSDNYRAEFYETINPSVERV